MQRDIINPWTWQEPLGFVHGNKVTGAGTVLYLAGQTASDEQGQTLCIGDIKGQIDRAIHNTGRILQMGGMDFTHVVRLNIYTTDLKALMDNHDHMVGRLREKGCRHAGTLLAVAGLAAPGALIELEATAAM